MKSLECPHCGADVTAKKDQPFLVCEYCGSKIYMEQEFFDHINQAYDNMHRMQERESSQALEQKALGAWENLRAFYLGVRKGWLILIAALFLLYCIISSDLVMDVFAPFLIFGSIYMIAGRPKLEKFRRYTTEASLNRYIKLSKEFHIRLVIWNIALCICWCFTNSRVLDEIATNIGTALLLIGPFFFFLTRPSRKMLEKPFSK